MLCIVCIVCIVCMCMCMCVCVYVCIKGVLCVLYRYVEEERE